jgi:hypothetical protein
MMILILMLLCAPLATAANPKLGPKIKLFNGKNLDGFYTFLGNHGKDNDPDHVFRVENGVVQMIEGARRLAGRVARRMHQSGRDFES